LKDTKREKPQLILFLQELQLGQIVAFRRPGFKEEREWRAVARPQLVELRHEREQQPSQQDETQGHRPDEPTMKHRMFKGILAPFVELKPANGELLPIMSVTYGPSLGKLKTKSAFMGFLVQHGHKRVEVLGCETPVLL
jgi:hypothetical protein